MEAAAHRIRSVPCPSSGALYYSERRKLTGPESCLWKRIACMGFRNQVAFGPYIADFLHFGAGLCVELDGKSHEGRETQDAIRDAYFAEHGWTVVRFRNRAATKDPELTALKIAQLVGYTGKIVVPVKAERAKKRAKKHRRGPQTSPRRSRRVKGPHGLWMPARFWDEK